MALFDRKRTISDKSYINTVLSCSLSKIERQYIGRKIFYSHVFNASNERVRVAFFVTEFWDKKLERWGY